MDRWEEYKHAVFLEPTLCRLRILALLALFGGPACDGGPTPPEQFVVVQTERLEYEPGDIVVVTLENLGFQAVEFVHCNYKLGLILERRESSQWTRADERGTACVAIALGGYVLESGAVYRDSLEVRSPGTYRIGFRLMRGAVSLESNTFVVASEPESE